MTDDRFEQILKYFDRLTHNQSRESTKRFRAFLAELFETRDLRGCYPDISAVSVTLSRSPLLESRHAPLMILSPRTSRNLAIEFRTTVSVEPATRTVTHSSNCRYEVALPEFDRLYESFVATDQN